MLAAQGIATGDIEIAVAGGMESMSNAPYLLPRVREGLRMGNGAARRLDDHDGLWCAFEQCHMGMSGEVVAEKYARRPRGAGRLRRREPSQGGATPPREGWFADEILPIAIPQKKGAPIVVDRDEPIREDTTVEALGALKPAFKKDGTVTAGNAPGVNDGAAALVVMSAEKARALGLAPLARIVGQATSGLAPKLVMMTPVEAVRKVAAKVGWNARRRRPLRDQRSVLGAGGRRHARARHRSGARQRPRRRGRARPPDRRQRRARPDDAALRDEAPQRAAAASRRCASAAATAWRWRWNDLNRSPRSGQYREDGRDRDRDSGLSRLSEL